MTTPPSHWPDKAMHLALTVLAIAVILYIAARLIVAVLPGAPWRRPGGLARLWRLVNLPISQVALVTHWPEIRLFVSVS
jgi:hypothetical protein